MLDTLTYGTAFRWTKATGGVDLGLRRDGQANELVVGLSADGSVIVGNLSNGNPIIWDVVHGTRSLEALLKDGLGLSNSLAGWSGLVVKGVSGDGRTVVGRGFNPDGNTEAWIAYLGPAVPEPNSIVLTFLAFALLVERQPRRVRVQTSSADGRTNTV